MVTRHWDLVIIGAGFGGAWCALEYLQRRPNARVLLLEKGTRPTGASTRNAGFSCIGSPSEMLNDAVVMGESKMLDLAAIRYEGLQKIQETFSPEIYDYEPCGGYELFNHDQPQLNLVKEKLDWLNESFARVSNEPEIFSWCTEDMSKHGITGFDAMVKNRLDGAIHSGKLLAALHRKAMNLGAVLMFESEVESWVSDEKNVLITTKSGSRISSEQLLLCTNAFTPELTNGLEITPGRGQVVVTNPIPGLKLFGTFHFDEGFYYFRHVGNRILLGGARNEAFEQEATIILETTEHIQGVLEHFISKHLLQDIPFEIDFRWAGVMAFTKSKLPEVFQLSKRSHALVACNGMGVALLPKMAEIAISKVIN